MKNLIRGALIFLIAFCLGYLTRMQVHVCTPTLPISIDTSYTDTSTVTTWDFSLPEDTTVSAVITYEDDNVGESVGESVGDDEKPGTGKNASTRISYADGTDLEIVYSYDQELFNVRYTPAPRPIQTNFITREITIIVPEVRARWDRPKLLFGAGCLTGSVITIIVVKLAIGALQ